MYSRFTSSNSYIPPLWNTFNRMQGWLDKLIGQLSSPHSQTRWVQTTILFTDIVGFSVSITHLPRYQQQKILESLTGEYYDLLRRCVRNWGGSVDKFIGDGMMAVFLTPGEAINAAREIQEVVAIFNTQQKRRGQGSFPTRIAVDSGWVIRKNLGSFWYRDQTFLGDAVNNASHLAQAGRPGQVLVSRRTLEQMPTETDFNCWRLIEGVGKSGEMTSYELYVENE